MKKIIIGSLIGISLTTLVAFTVANYEPKKATGEVEQMQGLYIFTDSKPVLTTKKKDCFTIYNPLFIMLTNSDSGGQWFPKMGGQSCRNFQQALK